jgi:hypothetical protein
MKAARLKRLRQGDRLSRSIHIADALTLGISLHVINRREVEKVVDLSRVLSHPGSLYTQAGFTQVTLDRYNLLRIRAPELAQTFELRQGTWPHQQKHLATPIQQLRNQKSPDKAGTARHKIVHANLLRAANLR